MPILRMRRGAFFSALFFCTFAAALKAELPHDPWLAWETYETEHFRVHAHEGLEEIAPRCAADCEAEYWRLKRFFRFEPVGKIDVVLADETDEANGEATPLPSNQVFYIVAPPDAIMGADEIDDWIRYLASHELTHIFHLDHARGFPKFMRYIFGRYPLFFPNEFNPTWIIEGLAAWSETNRDIKVGRGQSSFFKGLMRIEVENGVQAIRHVNQPADDWPAGMTRYLYGVYFMNFIEATYGKDAIRQWVQAYSGKGWPWTLNSTAEHAFGKSLIELWQDYGEWLQAQFGPEIEAIKKEGLRGQVALRPETGSYFWGPMKGLYAVRDDGASQERLQKLEGAHWRDLADMNQARFNVGPKRILAEESGWVHQSDYDTDLMEIDLQSGAKRRLTWGLRVREAVDMQGGIVALLAAKGQKSLVRLSEEGKILEVLWQGEAGENPSSLAVSPDGTRLVASVWREGKGWDLMEFDFQAKEWKEILARPEQELNPAWALDGQSLYFSADYGGIYNIWRLDLKTNALTQMTNVLGGAFQPNPLDADTLDFTMLTASGYERGELKLKDALMAAPPAIPTPAAERREAEPVDLEKHPYSPWPSLLPTTWVPDLEVGPQGEEFLGFDVANEDLLERHVLSVSALAGFGAMNDVFGSVDYLYQRYLPNLELVGSRFPTAELDSSGDILRERMSEAWGVGLLIPWSTAWSESGLDLQASGRHDWDEWVDASQTPYGDNFETLYVAEAYIDTTRQYAFSIGATDGLTAAVEYSRLFSQWYGDGAWVNWYLARPTTIYGLNILEMSLSGGQVGSGPYVFSLGQSPPSWSHQFSYRPSYSLAGYSETLPALQGPDSAVAHLAWRFPIVDPEYGYMAAILPTGLDRMWGRLIYEEGAAWMQTQQNLAPRGSIGLELDSVLVFGYNEGVQLNLGWARGLDADGMDEFYINFGGLLGTLTTGQKNRVPRLQN